MAEKAKKENGFVRFTKKAGKFFPRLQGRDQKDRLAYAEERFQKCGCRSCDDHPAWSLHFPAGYRLHEFAGSRHASGEISSVNDHAFI